MPVTRKMNLINVHYISGHISQNSQRRNHFALFNFTPVFNHIGNWRDEISQ